MDELTCESFAGVRRQHLGTGCRMKRLIAIGLFVNVVLLAG